MFKSQKISPIFYFFSKFFLVLCLFLTLFNSGILAQEGSDPVEEEATPCQEYNFPTNSGSAFIIANGLRASQLSQTTFTNQNVYIEGQFIVDRVTKFNNCKVKVAIGGSIKTDGNFGFLIVSNQTRIFCCGDTWKGIEVTSRGAIQFLDSYITEAEKAIEFRQGFNWQSSKVIGSKFYRNIYGLYAEGPSDGLGRVNVYFLDFRGNTFEGEIGYHPGINNLAINPLAAIKFKNVNSFLLSNGTRNKFNKANSAYNVIVIENTSLTLRNSDLAANNVNTKGIISTNSKLTLTGSLASNGCTIGVPHNGIEAKNSDLYITGCDFINCLNGIQSKENDKKVIQIRNNSFKENYDESAVVVERGIHLTPSTENFIQNNTFSLNRTPGIIVKDRAAGAAIDKFYIRDNPEVKITSSFQHGIEVIGELGQGVNESENFLVQRNVVEHNSDLQEGSHSISIVSLSAGSLNNRVNIIESNSVIGKNDHVRNFLCGIHIQENQFLQVCGNEMKGGLRGLHSYGTNTSTYLGNNYFRLNQVGLSVQNIRATNICNSQLISPGVLGPQTRTGNTWEFQNYSTGDATAEDCLSGQWAAFITGNENLSRFKVESDSWTIKPTDVNSPGWFQTEAGPLDYCARLAQLEPDPYARAVANNNLSILPAWQSRRWEEQLSLLHNTHKSPDVYLQDTDINTFYWASSNSNSSAYRFMMAEIAFREAMETPSTFYAPIDVLESQIEVKSKVVDSLAIVLDMSEENNLVLVGNICLEIGLLEDSIKRMVKLIDDFRRPRLSNALIAMEALPESEKYMSNRKILNIWEIKRALNHSVNEQDDYLSAIRAIAAQDEESGGSAVVEARQLLPESERVNYPPLNYNEHSEEDHQRDNSLLLEQNENDRMKLSIVPNPGKVHAPLIVTCQKDLHNATWTVYKSDGTLIESGKFLDNGTSQNIFCKIDNQGIYFIKVSSPEDTVTLKVMITNE